MAPESAETAVRPPAGLRKIETHMESPSSTSALADALLSFTPPEEFILSRVHQIHEDVLSHSPNIRQANFAAIHPRDLEFLFAAYDERFFVGLCRPALENRRLSFRLSPRMTRT